jgi:hypothetical protein
MQLQRGLRTNWTDPRLAARAASACCGGDGGTLRRAAFDLCASGRGDALVSDTAAAPPRTGDLRRRDGLLGTARRRKVRLSAERDRPRPAGQASCSTRYCPIQDHWWRRRTPTRRSHPCTPLRGRYSCTPIRGRYPCKPIRGRSRTGCEAPVWRELCVLQMKVNHVHIR